MDFLLALWLPILLSAVVLFFVSALAWMALPHHRADYGKLPQEDAVIAQLRQLNVPPGRYIFPYSGTHQNAQDPEYQRKFREGPVGTVTVFGPVNMGVNMVQTFVFFLLSSTMLAYLAWLALDGQPASFLRVFRLVGTAGVLTYTCAAIPNDIWFKRPLWTNLIDGVVYGLISGCLFALCWPAG